MAIEHWFEEAIAAYHRKEFAKAEALLKQGLQNNPSHLEGLYALAQLTFNANNFKESFDVVAQGLHYYPNHAPLLYLNGLLYIKANQWDNAQLHFRKCIDVEPKHERALFQLGRYHKQKNEFAIAEAYFRKALAIDPNEYSTLNNLANTLQHFKKYEESKELLIKALKINPLIAEVNYNLGNIYLLLNDKELTEKYVCKALEINPNYVQALVSYAQILVEKDDFVGAKNHLEKAINIEPSNVEALFLYANMKFADGFKAEAKTIYKKIIQLKPDFVKAYNALAGLHQHAGEIDLARKLFEKTIEIEPNNGEYHFNIAQVNEVLKNYSKANIHYQKSYTFCAEINHVLFFHKALFDQKICNWERYEETVEELKRRIIEFTANDTQQFDLQTLTLNYFPIEQALHLALAKKNAANLEKNVKKFKIQFDDYKTSNPKNHNHTRRRIGFVSPDFREHAVGIILKDLFLYFGELDIDIYAYTLTNANDQHYAHFKATATVFKDFTGYSELEAAKEIYNDEIEVLIDLAGNTTFSKPGIFALQPVKKQVHYMGYLDTMGASFLPYTIADKIAISEEMQSGFSEQIIYLDHFAFLSPLEKSTKKFTRSDFGLPENAFVFACFNSTQKMSPDWFEACMTILKQCPNSVFWVFNNDSKEAEYNLINEAQKHEIGTDRLVFAASIPFDEHIARCELADLFLDTFNYGAGLTAWAALSGNLPVLAYQGNTFLSRMTSSILHSLGLQEYIADSKIVYIEKAISFCNHRDEKSIPSIKNTVKKIENKNKIFVKSFEKFLL